MRDQELIGLYEAYQQVHRPTETTEELEYDTQYSYEDWVNQLVEEGYDISNWTDEGLYEIYCNEARDPEVGEYKGGKRYSLATRVRQSNAVKPAGKKPEGETGGVGQVKPDGKDPLDTNKSDYERFSLGLAPKTKTFRRPFGRKYDPAAIRNDAITSQMGKPKPEAPRRGVIKASYEMWVDELLNEGYDLSNWTSVGLYEYYEQLCEDSYELGQSQTPGGITPKRKPSPTPINGTPAIPPKRPPITSYKESYDIIFDYLISEGYADTEDSALVIMANMSEDWRESILSEDPVQDYRDMKRADENRSGTRGRELSHDTTPGLKGKPQPGSGSAIQKPIFRGREFTNPPS